MRLDSIKVMVLRALMLGVGGAQLGVILGFLSE
jgi:hypothetical protein